MLRNFHWHPLLLALYPALHLLARNTASVRPQAASLSLVVAAAAVLVIWGLCSAVLRNRGKGSLLAALVAILFFAHGHLLGLVGGGATAAWFLVGGGGALILTAGILLARWRGNAQPWNRTLDVVATTLTIMVLVPIARSEMRPATNLPTDERHADLQTPLGYLPDIYIIVMDAFGRADKLREIYDVDLTQLQEHLERNNFVIAGRANANYCQTSLSLAAFFNWTYLPELLPRFAEGYSSMSAVNNIVRAGHAGQRVGVGGAGPSRRELPRRRSQ